MKETDLLISRIVDRTDSPEDWARFDAFSAVDTNVSPKLVEALRNESTLRRAIREATAPAERVNLTKCRDRRLRGGSTWGGVANWSGWMAAAVLTLMWIASTPRDRAVVVEQPAVDAQLASGEFLRELPSVMVETRGVPGSDDMEVVYVRRTLERTLVSEAYTLAADESGQLVRSAVDLGRYTPRRRY